MNENSPLISVVIPAFNAATSLAKALWSCRDAGLQNIIVVDDGSSDDTAAIARQFGATCISTVNQGAAVARTVGLTQVSTKYVIFLDADDVLVAKGISLAAAALVASDSKSLVGIVGGYWAQPLNGKRNQLMPWRSGVNTSSLLKRGYSPGPPSCMILVTKKVREANGSPVIPLLLRHAEDYETLIRLSVVGNFETITHPVCVYQEDGGKSSRNPIENLLSANNIRNYYSRALLIPIKEWKPRDLVSIVLRRRALLAKRQNKLLSIVLSIRSFATSPSFYFQSLHQKIFATERIG